MERLLNLHLWFVVYFFMKRVFTDWAVDVRITQMVWNHWFIVCGWLLWWRPPAGYVVAVTVAQHPCCTAEAVSHHKPRAAPASWDAIHHRPWLFPAALHRNKIHVCVHLGPACNLAPNVCRFLSTDFNRSTPVNQMMERVRQTQSMFIC